MLTWEGFHREMWQAGLSSQVRIDETWTDADEEKAAFSFLACGGKDSQKGANVAGGGKVNSADASRVK